MVSCSKIFFATNEQSKQVFDRISKIKRFFGLISVKSGYNLVFRL